MKAMRIRHVLIGVLIVMVAVLGVIVLDAVYEPSELPRQIESPE